MQQGYIRLYRCMIDKGWSREPDHVALWIHLLFRASYKETEFLLDGKIKKLQPGQLFTSRLQLELATGINQSKIERIIKLFISEQQIEQQTFTKYRVITITNWHKFQAREQQNEQEMNSKRTTDEQQVNTYKKERKKEVKKVSKETKPLAICKAWKDYVEMRKSIKKPMTVNAEILAAGKLIELQSKGQDPVKVLEQSIFHSWQGLFEVKPDRTKELDPFTETPTVNPRTIPGNCKKCGAGKKKVYDGWECKKCGNKTKEREE